MQQSNLVQRSKVRSSVEEDPDRQIFKLRKHFSLKLFKDKTKHLNKSLKRSTEHFSHNIHLLNFIWLHIIKNRKVFKRGVLI